MTFHEMSFCNRAAPELQDDCVPEKENLLFFLNGWERSNPVCRWEFLCHLCSVRKEPKHLQLIVRLFHCVHRAILTLPTQGLSPAWSTIYHRKWSVEDCVILNKDMLQERCEAEQEKLRCCWFCTEYRVQCMNERWVCCGGIPDKCSLILLKAKGDSGQ